MSRRKKTSEIISEILPKKKKQPSLPGLHSGSTLLNLACSGDPDVGFLPGHYYFLVGDSASGKTWLSLTCLAEASINPAFDNYRFIYDNSENGALMNIEKYFGKKVAERIEPPYKRKDESCFSTTVEEFYYYADDAVKEGKPFIYILDSMDSLSADDDEEKFEKNKKARQSERQESGSFGTAKAKANSSNLRRLVHDLRKTNSILIIISQTRDNLGFGFEKKTRSGGKALKFYAALELWSSVKQKLRRPVMGKPRTIGILSQIQVKKNRIQGKERTVDVPIFYSHGIDDVGSCVDFLINEGHWKKGGKGKYDFREFGLVCGKESLISHVEEKGLENQLFSLVSGVWDEIEKGCEIQRKFKY